MIVELGARELVVTVTQGCVSCPVWRIFMLLATMLVVALAQSCLMYMLGEDGLVEPSSSVPAVTSVVKSTQLELKGASCWPLPGTTVPGLGVWPTPVISVPAVALVPGSTRNPDATVVVGAEGSACICTEVNVRPMRKAEE